MHALLSPSGAGRWIACPPSARLESSFPNRSTSAADEGTLAHSLSELYLRNHLKLINNIKFQCELKKIKHNPYYNKEMDDHCMEYMTFILEKMNGMKDPTIAIEELIDLTKSVSSCSPCMDFSHLFARTNEYNTYEEFCTVLKKLKEELDPNALQNMHIHISGISSNSKGDLKHLNLDDSDFNWRELLRALKDFDCRGYVICNSPNLEKDAKMMKDFYLAL